MSLFSFANYVIKKYADISVEPEYFYHVTFLRNLEGIAKVGLVCGKSGMIGNMSDNAYSKGKIFVSDGSDLRFWFNAAEQTANDRSDNVLKDKYIPVVLRIKNIKDMEEDERGRDYGAYYLKASVKPSDIEVFDGGDWIDVASWRDIDAEDAIDIENADGEELHWLKSDSPFLPKL